MAGGVLGIDIGGTFTDVVLVDARGRACFGKCPTTSDDPNRGLLQGVRQVLDRSGCEPTCVVRVVHGTTLASNVILERKGAPVAFVTTRGFRSLLTLGRGARVEEQRFDLFFDPPESPVPASHCFEVSERVGAGGLVLEPLDEADAERVAERVARLGVAAVAICFLHSYARPEHERRMRELLREKLPEATVVASSDVWPELREYERATTTLMAAYVAPVMAGYLSRLRRLLAEIGIDAPIHIMESSGGMMSAELAAQRAVYTIESGPAAGVVSAVQVGRELGIGDMLSLDMGGTTAKAGVIRDGRADVTHSFHVGGAGSFGGRREGTGVPIKVPAIDLAEVGAGGGSIAWLDAGGSLHVGPRSAGASPGPACYGLGGEEPTVTDADLLLGYLNPKSFAGGSVPLYPERARAAIETRLCGPLGISTSDAAEAVHRIANARMGSAVHVVTVQRGIDPRRCALVALGGAGPVHAARVAERFGIGRVLVPFGSGVGSALGLLAADVATERSRTRPMREESVDFAQVAGVFAELAESCVSDLGVDPAGVQVERRVDMRYQGQAHELTVSAPEGETGEAWLAELVERFHAHYLQSYGNSSRGSTELVGFRVRVTQPLERPRIAAAAAGAPSRGPTGSRPAYFEERGGYVETAVYERARLRAGDAFSGPAIVEEAEATLVVPPGWQAGVDASGHLRLDRDTPESAADG